MRWSSSAMVVAGVIALSACASGAVAEDVVAEDVVRGIPQGWTGPAADPMNAEPQVGWIGDDQRRFGIVTYGSSSCPPRAEELSASGTGALEVRFAPSEHDAFTADLGPTTHVFALPPEIIDRPIVVVVVFDGGSVSLELP